MRARWPSLTDKQAAAVVLYERGLSLRAIAHMLGITHVSVRDRLAAAERRIARHEREAAP